MIGNEGEVLRENLSSAALATTSHTWLDLASNLSHHGGKLVTNCLSYCTLMIFMN
jgi:hypothetical protein